MSTLQENARAASKRSYALNRDRIAKRRFLRRIADGTSVRVNVASLVKFGMSADEVNAVRKCNGLEPLPDPLGVPLPCPLAKDSVATPVAAGSEAKGRLSVADVAERLKGLEGRVKLMKNGKPHPRGETIKANTASLYASQFRVLMSRMGYPDGPDAPAYLAANVGRLKSEVFPRYYKALNSRKQAQSLVVTAAKYIPEFAAAFSPGDLDALGADMKALIGASKDKALLETVTKAVVPMAELRTRVADAKRRLGAESEAYVAALLQTHLVGLRADLERVIVVRKNPGKAQTAPANYYNRASGNLVIRDFKTKDTFPPYKFALDKVRPGLKAEVNAMLDARQQSAKGRQAGPEKLFTKRLTPMLRDAIGAGVLDIRHSMVTEMVGGARAEYDQEKIEAVAKLFKHTPEMTRRYVRQDLETPTSSEDA